MGFLSRLLGICRTRPPAAPEAWRYAQGSLEIELPRVQELEQPGGAVRLEGRGLPVRVLIVHGEDGEYHAFRNHCTHAGRRLDPLPGQPNLMCCSVNKSTYDYHGDKLAGPAKGPVDTYPVDRRGHLLIVDLSETG
ncbi:MAG: Rieske (2Fe-2S) protein [Proteobacteria bacterium]|nr:Rieske (2Fe-2S) protein [Pseudomonadota bacterium]